MKKNMGSVDKIVRIVIAVVLGILFYTGVISGVLGIVLLVVAGIFLLTGFVSFCPIYAIFGMRTCAIDTKK